jgi:hypothetical protein
MSACTTVNVYQSPLTQLSDATRKTRLAITELSKEANQLAAENLAIEAAEKGNRFGDPELAKVIPDTYLTFRDMGLDLIERLAARLLAVVSLDDGEKAAAALETLGESAKKFAEQHGSQEFARYAGPVGQLAATVIRIYDAHVRAEILREGVQKGVPPARRILAELRADFDPKSARNITGALAEELSLRKTERIHAYDQLLLLEKDLPEKERLDPKRVAARYAAIVRIIEAQNAVEAMKEDEAAEALTALERALEALEASATSGFKSGDFARAAAEISEFSRRAQSLVNGVKAIRDARVNAAN